MTRRLALALLVISLAACSDNDSTPTNPGPPPLVGLTGTVTATNAGTIAGATIRILDGANVGQSTTTNSTGQYTFANLTQGNANLSANATIYDQVILGVNINGTNTLNFIFPVPACQTNNTGSIRFGNRSSRATYDIIWDGGFLFTLAPGQTSDPIVSAAGVAHTLRFRVTGSNTLACADSRPVLNQCERGDVISCSGG